MCGGGEGRGEEGEGGDGSRLLCSRGRSKRIGLGLF